MGISPRTRWLVFSVAIVCTYVLLPQQSFAATEGPNSPGTAVSNDAVGTKAWTTPEEAASNDNVRARSTSFDSVGCGTPSISEYLHLSNFGFSIPDAATINGITIEIERWGSDNSSIKDNRFRIVKGGTISTTDRADTDEFWDDANNNGYITYGSGSDLWGETWTAADINNANFGVVLSVSFCGFDPGYSADVDHLRITVDYTVDVTAPTVSTLSPADNATGIATNSNLVIEFDEVIESTGTGSVRIYKTSGDELMETINVASGAVTGSGTDTITINPTTDLDDQTAYYVQIDDNAFPDSSGNFFAGIADKTTWNFTTADESAPTVSTLSPADEATNAAITANLVITFDESIGRTGTGFVTLYKASDDSVVETFAVTGALVTGSGTAIITINPTSSLANSTAYYVQIDANAFPDGSENFYAGIADKTTWNFTTVAVESNSNTSNDTDNTGTEIARGGRRGAGTNRLHFQPIGGNPEQNPHSTNDPLHTLLWNVYARLEERIQRRIVESPHVAPLFERVLERLKMRIEAIIADQA